MDLYQLMQSFYSTKIKQKMAVITVYYKLNQDLLITVIRQKRGYNRNLSARVFRASFRFSAIRNVMHPQENTNY